MARPRLGDGAAQRLHMMITAAELEAIDNWQKEMGLPSRAEAVRRLCAAGMVALNALDKIADMTTDLYGSLVDDDEAVGGTFRGFLQDRIDGIGKQTFTSNEVKDLWRDHSERIHWAQESARYIDFVVWTVLWAANAYLDPKPFTAAEREASAELDWLNDEIEKFHLGQQELEAHHTRQETFRNLTPEEQTSLEALEAFEDRLAFLEPRLAKTRWKRERRRRTILAKIEKRRAEALKQRREEG